MDPYTWPLVDEFVNREEELARLEEWWASPERMPISMYGRRRVGKSWLLRRFAHGKPAVILASERLAPGTQLSRFAALLEPGLGVRPEIPDLLTLFRVAYRLASEAKALVVIDELPWLLPGTEAEIERALSSIQAVMEEERDSSQLKLVLCGSAIAQMQALMSERGPLHGRLRALEIRPLRYPQAQEFLDTLDPVRRIERFAIAGGMPRYLSELGRGTLENVICTRVLDRDGPLWNEARAVLEQELTQPGVYFSILEQLATGEKQVDRIASGARIENTTVSRYLATLTQLRIVYRKLPAGAAPSSRGGHWELSDPFLRFWFRFVFPFQAELESGLKPKDLWQSSVKPALSDHVAPVFEDLCRDWTRTRYGRTAQRVGSWWGNARNDLRRTGARSTEEIDIVGLSGSGNRVTVIGECRWRNKAMDGAILTEIDDFKLPALRQAGYEIDEDLRVLLFSRGGYNGTLSRAASANGRLRLVGIDEVMDLSAGVTAHSRPAHGLG
ncbi:MAG: ATP-binding protein [Solirubrobacteraceae bacterium]